VEIPGAPDSAGDVARGAHDLFGGRADELTVLAVGRSGERVAKPRNPDPGARKLELASVKLWCSPRLVGVCGERSLN